MDCCNSRPEEPKPSAATKPIIVTTLCQNGYERIEAEWRGQPIYVNLNDGEMCYEADGEHLVSLPEGVQEKLVEAQVWEWTWGNASAAVRDALASRVRKEGN